MIFERSKKISINRHTGDRNTVVVLSHLLSHLTSWIVDCQIAATQTKEEIESVRYTGQNIKISSYKNQYRSPQELIRVVQT